MENTYWLTKKYHSLAYYLFGVCAGFSLYDLPTAPVLYGSILSGFAGLVFTAVDFILYRRRCIVLQKLEKEITVSVENLPQPHKAYFINFILYQIIIFRI